MAAGKATATYSQFNVNNTVALSLGFKADVRQDVELKVSHVPKIQLAYYKDKVINNNNVGEENNNTRNV